MTVIMVDLGEVNWLGEGQCGKVFPPSTHTHCSRSEGAGWGLLQNLNNQVGGGREVEFV